MTVTDLFSIVTYAVPFLAVLTVLVFVHELGHYSVARWAGIRVEVFSIGFGNELFGWNDKHGTRWRLSMIPIGGYVKMYGDNDEASVPDTAALAVMSDEDRKLSVHGQPLPVRAAVMAAGPAANFVLAIVLLTGVYWAYGQPYTPAKIGEVTSGSAAEAAGIRPGDEILAIDGQAVDRFEDLKMRIMLNTGTPVHITLRRDGAEMGLDATPRITSQTDILGNQTHTALLGLRPAGEIVSAPRGPVGALVSATEDVYAEITGTLRAVGQMLVGSRNTDDLGGPIKILQLSHKTAELGIVPLIVLLGSLSTNIGLVNLFPIPVLDGGHLLFYAAEALLGRPLGQRTQEIGYRVGLAVVLMLMLFTTTKDLHLFELLRSLVT